MQLGALGMFELSDVVELRTGLIYSQKGAAENDLTTTDYYGNSTGKDDMIFALDYLEVPVDFAFKLGDAGFALSAGPYLGILMSAKAKFDGEEIDVDELVNGIDVGINIGASFIVNESVLIDVRYGVSITDISDVEETNYYGYSTGDYSSDNNKCFSISIGYVFGG